MGNENMGQAQQLAGQKPGEIAEIKQQGAPLVMEIQIEARIPEGIVDKPGVEQAVHGYPQCAVWAPSASV
ncbi:hypothetical protein A3768_1392 [Ralstonia solanacearum]|nr:hypothetical protein A3768_1392 [Ralstonia solanacearum]